MMSNLPSPIRGEYPRPDRVRENWLALNGQWDFAFDRENRGLAADRGPLSLPEQALRD